MAHTVNHRQDGSANYSAAAAALFGVTPNFFKAYSGKSYPGTHSAQIPLQQPPAPTYIHSYRHPRSLFPGAGSFRPDRFYAGQRPDLEARMLELPNASDQSHLQQNPVAAASTWEYSLKLGAVEEYLPGVVFTLPIAKNVVPVTADTYAIPLPVTLMAYGFRGVDPSLQPQVGHDGRIEQLAGPLSYHRLPLEEFAGKRQISGRFEKGRPQIGTQMHDKGLSAYSGRSAYSALRSK